MHYVILTGSDPGLTFFVYFVPAVEICKLFIILLNSNTVLAHWIDSFKKVLNTLI